MKLINLEYEKRLVERCFEMFRRIPFQKPCMIFLFYTLIIYNIFKNFNIFWVYYLNSDSNTNIIFSEQHYK